MAISSPSSSSFLDTFFYCEEQDHPWHDHDHDDDDDDGHDHGHVVKEATYQDSAHLPLPPLNQQDLFWEDEELVSLFTKEQQQRQTSPFTFSFDEKGPSLLLARKEAVDWILKVKSHFGFTHLTAILSVNYLDRFLSGFHCQKENPWMIQLLAVACLSLAAKLEEAQVPPLLDLQVEGTKYLFEAKNIQKMELLVMSTLKWKMNPVTPISFLDHIVRRLGLKTHLHWDFFKKCEALILFLVSDSRFIGYPPSVLATATMLHVIDHVDFFNSVDYQNELLDVLKTTKEKVKECYEMVMEASEAACFQNPKKRKPEEDDPVHSSPVGVMDADFCPSPPPSPSSSSHHHPPPKKTRITEPQKLGFASLSCRSFVDVGSSPH